MLEDSWHVLHVIANHEKRVSQHLSVRSLEHYLPIYKDRSRWSDRWVIVERPLFPGYLFVRFSLQTRLSVISTPSVIRLLGDDDHETVSTQEIERIRNGLASGCQLRPHPLVRVGTPVRVKSGVFEGVDGVVTELRRRCKVILSLGCAEQCFSLEVDLRDLDVLRNNVQRPAFAGQRSIAIA
jgi:transcription antitermination factor NusG